MVQTRSTRNRSRGPREKSLKESDSSWFQTFETVALLFLGSLLIMKTLGRRSKKRTARGPPDFARRGPLGRRWRRVLRTMIIQNQLNTDSMQVVTHGMSLAREPPVIFESLEVICGGLVVDFLVSQNHEKHDFSCVKINFKLIWNDLG